MELTPRTITERAREYRTEEPLYAVESDHLEILPKTFESGEYGRRDVQWPVRWYYRRHLGSYPDKRRRDAEERFEENDFGDVKRRIDEAVAAASTGTAVESLLQLDAIDVGVASAFLFFLDPSRYVSVGPREWGALKAAGELPDPYPDPPTTSDYERYLGVCRQVAERTDCDLWTLYRALWRLSGDDAADGG